MNDFDRFDRRLAAALRSDADQGVARFDPASVARAAIDSARPRPFRARLRPVLAFGRPSTRVAYLLVVIGVVLAIVVGAIAAGALRTRRVGPSGWNATSAMTKARESHAATLLPNGKVLVAGGSSNGDPFASAELYDPATRSWTATGSMAQGRQGHTATLLHDGRVLVAGGAGSGVTLATAELYDPARGSWTATGSMHDARVAHTATLLPDGRVLVSGGFGLASAELYDPRTETWTSTGAMDHDRGYHTATLLPDGDVLVVGGFSGPDDPQTTASAELFDPGTGIWTSAPGMVQRRAGHTATLLSDGRVLVVGGSSGGGSFQPTASAELYEPRTGSWIGTGSMNVARVYAAATLMPDGSVLLAGGFSGTSNIGPTGPVAPAELFDPTSGSWSVTNPMTSARTRLTATLLADGTVLVTGGGDRPALSFGTASAELYGPDEGSVP